MKHLVLALGLGAALATPLSASAMTQSDNAPVTAHQFLIVDPASGRTVATLLPIAGQPHELRLIGTIAAPVVALTPTVIPDAIAPLTVGQVEKARDAAYRAQFHIPDSTP